MSWPLVLERLDTRGRVLSHVRLHGPNAVIGRSYDCDVVIDDPHVAARHARLEVNGEGELTISDLGSINGTWSGTSEQEKRGSCEGLSAGQSRTLAPGHIVKLGLTRLRVVSPMTEVAAEIPLARRGAEAMGARLLHAPAWAMALSVLALVGLSMAESWFSQVHRFQPVTTLSRGLTTVGGILLWSGVWALLTRVVRGHSRWLRHAAWASLLTICWAALEWVSNTVAFALDWPRLGTWAFLLELMLGVVLLLGHWKLTFDAVSGRARASMVAMALGGLAVSGFYSWQTHRQILAHDFMTALRPPSWRLTAPLSTDEHFSRAASLVGQVDALRPVDFFDHDAAQED